MNSSNSSEDDFLAKLNEITEANLTNPQFGVSMLARELGMSRSNLHRKVNELTKITVSQFINQVRLKSAMEILRHTSNTVSEVAHQTGFSNTSYFIKKFHEYYGYTPGEVGNREDDESNRSSHKTNKKQITRILVPVLFLVILAVALILVFKPFSHNQKQQIISIAVLPFIDDSPEEGNEYIINGVRREILGKLGKIKDLRVIPGSSAEKYSNSNLSISEIAKELNADYILCGNGQKIGTSIKIILELIETKTGYNLWTKPYIKEVNDNNIFELQEEMSLAVAGELEVNITPDEKERIAKIPTDNKIAWDFYLRGIEKKTDSLEVAITLFEKALELDKEFAIAYAELAYCYYSLDRLLADKIHLDLINYYADWALAYDSELDLSWIAKGLFYTLKGENKLAIIHLKKALRYNPNSGLAVLKLAQIYTYSFPDSEQAIEYGLLSIRLDIETDDNYCKGCELVTLSRAFRNTGFFDEAEKFLNRSFEFDPIYSFAIVERSQLLPDITGKYEQSKKILVEFFDKDSSNASVARALGLTCYFMRDFDDAFKYYKKLAEIQETQNLVVDNSDYGRIGHIFKIMGDVKKSEEYFKKNMDVIETLKSIHKYRLLAAVYSYRGDTINAIAQMKILSQQDNYPSWVIRILKHDPMFDNIRELAEFQKILSEMEAKFWKNHERIKASLKEKGLL